jgi:cytochrome c oxidase cbb3-type subunit 4
MQTYDFLRHLADSWFLLAMFALFVGVVIYAFRPAARRQQHEAASSIFRNEDRPAKKEPTE